jgi:hypothetical protein
MDDLAVDYPADGSLLAPCLATGKSRDWKVLDIPGFPLIDYIQLPLWIDFESLWDKSKIKLGTVRVHTSMRDKIHVLVRVIL